MSSDLVGSTKSRKDSDRNHIEILFCERKAAQIKQLILAILRQNQAPKTSTLVARGSQYEYLRQEMIEFVMIMMINVQINKCWGSTSR